MLSRRVSAFAAALGMLAAIPAWAQIVANRYIVILQDPPVAARVTSKTEMHSAATESVRQQIEARQQALRTELASRNIRVTGSVSTVLNALFVAAPQSRLDEIKSLPGVLGVAPMRRYRLNLNRATQLVSGPAAWGVLGGIPNAGAGIKIGIIDTGIEQTNPAFQDPSLPMPAGFPKCTPGDCVFTNNKVIVARSYVALTAQGSDPSNPAADSRPDDLSARDRDGHGTSVASCAAANLNTGAVTFNGLAPKAYLGNYKIYGSPGVNDGPTSDAVLAALQDAVDDGMDIVSYSSGAPALGGALDSGAVCGNPAGVPCDPVATAFENAAKAGTIVVVAAGNDGRDGSNYPTFNSISSPANAPSVIAAGATTNSHTFLTTVSVPGNSTLQGIATDTGDSYMPPGALSAPLRDVASVGDNGLACSPMTDGSLVGAIALIERGTCQFSTKMNNAQNAGALAVIFYMADSSALIPPGGLSSYNIPGLIVSNSDGLALKSNAAGQAVVIDPAGIEQSDPGFNQLAGFSSFGPNPGDSAIKPDLVAPGTSMYMAAETYDPLGELYSATGYAVADGTSFATPITSGAAALVKQAHPTWSAAQVKSALVNTASQDVTTDESGDPVDVEWLGAGKLSAGAAVSTNVTVAPAALSFGVLASGSLPKSQPLQITNAGSSAVNLTLAVAAGKTSPATTLALDKQSLSLAPGATGAVNITLSGTLPAAGEYSGALTIQGGSVPLRVPYMYLVGSGVAANITALVPYYGQFDGTVGQVIPDGELVFKVTDANGVPVAGAPVTWTSRGGGSLANADTTTDVNGMAGAIPTLGSTPGNYSFVASAGGQRLVFSGTARLVPTISAIVNAASNDNTVAPGSYITLYGTGLSDATGQAATARLPLNIDLVTVSFDVPSAGISVPGHLTYVSPGQVNVQVPWELQGQTSAQVKVTIDYSNGAVFTMPVAATAPAIFEVASGQAAALDANYKLIVSGNPAPRGQTIQIYANGLGPVTNQPASGDPAPSSALARTTTLPTVSIGGQPATVLFSGLAPGFAGLYQLNVTVPSGIAPGNAAVSISIGGHTSKSSGIYVQ